MIIIIKPNQKHKKDICYKKTTFIITSALVFSILVMFADCGGNHTKQSATHKAEFTGHWENEKSATEKKVTLDFNYDGTCEGYDGHYGSATGTYTIDGDGTLHIIGFSSSEIILKKQT